MKPIVFTVNGLVYGTIRWIDDTLYVKDKNSIVEGEVYDIQNKEGMYMKVRDTCLNV